MITKKRLISYVLSIVFAACVAMLVIAVDLNLTALSKSNLKKKVASADYYNKIYEITARLQEESTVAFGFDKSVIENVYTKQDVEIDINHAIDKIYNNWEFGIDTSKQRATLHANVESYAASREYVLDDEANADIKVYEDTIEEIYTKSIVNSSEDLERVSKQVQDAKSKSKIAIAVALIGGAILAYALYRINSPAIGIGMMIAGAVMIVARICTETSVKVQNISVFNQSFSDIMVSVINQTLTGLTIVGAILCVVGLIWIVVVERMINYTKVLLLDEHSQVIR